VYAVAAKTQRCRAFGLAGLALDSRNASKHELGKEFLLL